MSPRSHAPRARSLAIAVVTACLFAAVSGGCGGDDDDPAGSATAEPGSTTTVAVEVDAPATSAPDPSVPAEEGRDDPFVVVAEMTAAAVSPVVDRPRSQLGRRTSRS